MVEKNNLNKEQELLEYDGSDKIISSKEALEQIQQIKESLYKFYSKIPSLDKYTDGFEAGELIIISGPTKHGKSTLSFTLTRNFERQDIKCLWFQFEIPIRQFITKFPDLPLFYLPNKLKDKDIEWVKDRILEGIVKYNTRIVFIDHLHYLIDIYKTRDASIDIGRVIRDLKRFAVDNNIVIFVMAHTTKVRLDSIPTEENVRDSSFIPQEADSTFMIWRESKRRKNNIEYTGNTFLLVLNHRRTGVMMKAVKLVFNNGYLFELEENAQEDPGDIQNESFF